MSEVFFSGPAGRIEGKIIAQEENPTSQIALVLHPHPEHGGTMDNKVVYNLYKMLYENGFTVLRINFRGVGKSTGKFDDGIGELTDAATALDWLQANYPNNQVTTIAGFSFGSWIAMQLIMRRPDIDRFIAIAPPVNKYDFSFLSPCPIPGLIIQGNMDSIVEESQVTQMVETLQEHKNIDINYQVIHGADHFFRDKIDLMNKHIQDYLTNEKKKIVASKYAL